MVVATLCEKSHAFISAHPSAQRVNSERPAGGKGVRIACCRSDENTRLLGTRTLGKAELGKLSASFQSVASN